MSEEYEIETKLTPRSIAISSWRAFIYAGGTTIEWSQLDDQLKQSWYEATMQMDEEFRQLAEREGNIHTEGVSIFKTKLPGFDAILAEADDVAVSAAIRHMALLYNGEQDLRNPEDQATLEQQWTEWAANRRERDRQCLTQ